VRNPSSIRLQRWKIPLTLLGFPHTSTPLAVESHLSPAGCWDLLMGGVEMEISWGVEGIVWVYVEGMPVGCNAKYHFIEWKHQETCHLLFWTCTSLYEWKSRKVNKEPRIKKKLIPKFIFRRSEAPINPLFFFQKVNGYFPDEAGSRPRRYSWYRRTLR